MISRFGTVSPSGLSTIAVKKCDILLGTVLWGGWKLKERKNSHFGMLRALADVVINLTSKLLE